MAKLQMFFRLATPVPLQLLSSSIVRLTPPSGTRFVASTWENLSAAASDKDSCTRGWANYPGCQCSATERGISRAVVIGTEARIVAATTRPSESLSTASLQDSFDAEVTAGRGDCCSRVCRLICDGAREDCILVDDDCREEAFNSLDSRVASYTSRRTMRDLEIRPNVSFPLDFAEFVNDVWTQKSTAIKYFEIAVKRNPNDADVLLQYAQFAWKTLGDLDKADELFTRALEESPVDSDAHAIYALFLWQTEE